MTTKEDLLQDWLPRLWGALLHVRAGNPAAAEEDLYELYVEMKQQTLAEKLETFSETTIEDQLSAAMIELRNTQKRLAQVELGICQRAFEQPQQRTWVGLTDEERKNIWTADQMTQEEWDELFDTVEAKLKEKNT